MKRTLIPGLMLLAAFTLTNCSEQLAPPVQEDDVIVEETPSTEATEEEILGIPFEVYANASDEEVDTKTTNVDGGNYTAWEATDAIYVYHAPAGSTSGFTKNHKFSMRNLAENLFGGALYKEANLNATSSYDWYFIYPNKEEGLGSAGTQSTVNANLVIGAAESDGYIQTQKPIKVKTGEVENTLYSNKNHIAGDNYPMYGKTSIKGDENPRIKMKHLSALVALKIVNQGDGVADNGNSSIEINNVEFVAPEEVVGNFKVTVSQTPIKYDKVAASATAKVNLADANGDGITIEPGEEALVYFAVKPFTAKKDAKITIKINGSPRTVPMPNDIKFEAGKVTTLRVPVKLTHSKASDALGEFLSLPSDVEKSAQQINVNGEQLYAYVIGNGKEETLTIQGKVVDLINAFDVGFYASVWNGMKSAMTVTKMNAWIHETGEDGKSTRTQIADYAPLINAIRTELADDKLVGTLLWVIKFDVTDIALGLVTAMLSSGVEREGTFGLTKFIQPSTITFRGIVENGLDAPLNNMISDLIILNEEQIHKKIDANTIDNQLFKNRFPGARFAGLRDMINNKPSTDAANTADILYSTIEGQFCKDAKGNERNVSVRVQKDYGIAAVDVNAVVNFRGILNGLFTNGTEMAELLRKLEVKVEISTIPYSDNEADYGVKDAPLTPDAPYNPIILWGFSTNQDFSSEN